MAATAASSALVAVAVGVPTEHIDEAYANQHKLWHYMTMAETEFAALPYSQRSQRLHEVLRLPQKAVATRHNAVVTLSGLRDVFAFGWVDRDRGHVMKYLLDARVTCKHCFSLTAIGGVFDTNKASLARHQETPAHVKRVADLQARHNGKRQMDLVEAGLRHIADVTAAETRRALVTASLIAGGNGAAGIIQQRGCGREEKACHHHPRREETPRQGAT